MAFNPNRAPAASTDNDSWKAQAFINIYLPKAGGEGKMKIGAIPLKASNKYEAALIAKLSSEPTSIEDMLKLVTMDFRLADDPKAPAPALPF